MPSGPISKRAEGITVHRRLSGDPRGNPQTEASHPKQFPQGIPGRVMKSVENSATSKRASEGSASEPSLAHRVSMCKDAKVSCRGNSRPERPGQRQVDEYHHHDDHVADGPSLRSHATPHRHLGARGPTVRSSSRFRGDLHQPLHYREKARSPTDRSPVRQPHVPDRRLPESHPRTPLASNSYADRCCTFAQSDDLLDQIAAANPWLQLWGEAVPPRN